MTEEDMFMLEQNTKQASCLRFISRNDFGRIHSAIAYILTVNKDEAPSGAYVHQKGTFQ